MKTKILIFVLAFVPICSFGQEVSVDSLLHKIDSIRVACSKLNNKDKVKGFESALVLQDSVYKLMADSVRYFSAFEKDARAYQFFVCTGDSVFSQNYHVEIDTCKLPKYMQEHCTAVSTIRLFTECIMKMENQAKDAEEANDVAEADRKNYVAIKIKLNIDEANELLDRIDKLNMSSFSEEQNKFYQDLLERLSDILNKYIF